MSFYPVFDFLRALDKNNSKAWMDEHRSTYYETRDFVISWTDDLNRALEKTDSHYVAIPGKKAITRINNNLVYHPNKPTYKDHFGVEVHQGGGRSSFYLHLGINGSFIGGGYYHPPKDVLSSIRDAIDYNGDVLKKIINRPSFANTFGTLEDEDALKTAPKGFPSDHPHIDLLRLKSFAVRHTITQKEIASDDFIDQVVTIYQKMLPFSQYLNKAVSV